MELSTFKGLSVVDTLYSTHSRVFHWGLVVTIHIFEVDTMCRIRIWQHNMFLHWNLYFYKLSIFLLKHFGRWLEWSNKGIFILTLTLFSQITLEPHPYLRYFQSSLNWWMRGKSYLTLCFSPLWVWRKRQQELYCWQGLKTYYRRYSTSTETTKSRGNTGKLQQVDKIQIVWKKIKMSYLMVL